MDRMAGRLAAIEDIPQTRFMGRSPAGLNATGDSDLKNWALKVEGNRDTQLAEPLDLIHTVVARNDGMEAPPEHQWHPILDMSDQERAEATEKNTTSVVGVVSAGLITEEEGRERLTHDPYWEGLPEEMPEELKAAKEADRMMEEEAAAAAIETEKERAKQAANGGGGKAGGGGPPPPQ